MRAQFSFEWLLFTRNIKNRMIFIIFLLAALYYGVFLAPDYQPLYSFADEDAIAERIEEQTYILETYSERPRTAQSAQSVIHFSEIQFEALRQEDWTTYFEAMQRVNYEIRQSRYGNSVDPRFFDINESYPSEEEAFWRGYTNERFHGYGEEDIGGIGAAVVDERTVLQTIQRLFQGKLPFILLIVLVLLSVDILTKDKQHPTVFNSKPLAFGMVLWVKTLATISGFLLTLLAGFLALLLTIGPRYGVGSFSIPLPVSIYYMYGSTFERISLGVWYLQAFALLMLSSLILIRLITWLSVVIRQELLNLVVGVSILFTESLYYTRGIGFFSDIGLLPPTFFSIGSVLMGYHNSLYASQDIHFINGVLSLGAALLVIECLLFVTTRFRLFRKI